MTEIKKKAILDVLNIALQREIEAFNYYQKAGNKAYYQETEALLIQLAEEERKHRLFLLREIERINNLMAEEIEESHVEAEAVKYQIPEEIPFKRLQSVSGVDLSATSLPTELLGGDFFDTMPLYREDKNPALGIFLYDVMGHGMEATHLKALAKNKFGLIREAWVEKRPDVDMWKPYQVITNLNKNLIEHCQSCGRFVSAFYGVVDPVENTFTYTSAGHDPPIYIKVEGVYIHLNKTELLLGVDDTLTYKENVVPITEGDILTIFSDGITEAINSQEEMFTRIRLANSIKNVTEYSAAEILSHIFSDLRAFLQDEPLDDEITIGVLKISKENSK